MRQVNKQSLQRSNQIALQQRFNIEHAKKKSSAKTKHKPIVFYLADDIPKPYRKAIRIGFDWWQQGFKSVGLPKLIQLKNLPKKTDLQNGKYNVIQWSSDDSMPQSSFYKIVDPRSGEIIRAVIRLNEYEIRHQNRLARALTSGWKNKKAARSASEEFSLAFLRLRAAFFIGRSLGLAVNLAGF